MHPHHVHSRHRVHIAAPADTAFMFFTPAGEELWVPDWRPRYVRPADGATQAGMVFTTGEDEQYTLWLLVDFDRQARRSRYVRTTPALRMGTVQIACAPLGPGDCEVAVQYDLTALSPAGEASLAAFRPEAFADMIDGWARAIQASLPRLLATPIR